MNQHQKSAAQTEKQRGLMRRQLRGIVITLVLVFILGVSLTTFVAYDPKSHSVVQLAVLSLHMFAAVWVAVSATIQVVQSRKQHVLQSESAAGLGSLIVAASAGLVASGSGNSWAVFVMALGFIAALSYYGRAYIRLNYAPVA